MARTSSIFNEPLSGNLGNQTLKNYSGTQVAVSRFRTTSAKGAGASYDQRLTRLQLPNIVLAGSQLKKYLPCLFERNRYFVTPYTHFISHNKNASLPCQPRFDIESKYCHWGKLVVGCGSLPFIGLHMGRDFAYTDISTPRSMDMWDTTVGEMSSVLMASNYGFLAGDFLFIVTCITSGHLSPSTNEWTYISTPRFGYLQLDPNSSVMLDSVPTLSDVSLRSYSPSEGKQYVATGVPSNGSVAYIHVRKVGTRYLSSPATMVLGSESARYEGDATSSEWIERCAQSYGYKPDIL